VSRPAHRGGFSPHRNSQLFRALSKVDKSGEYWQGVIRGVNRKKQTGEGLTAPSSISLTSSCSALVRSRSVKLAHESAGQRVQSTVVKLEIEEDATPLLVRALEHYAAYLGGHQASG